MKRNPVLSAEDPMYPSSDGLPLAENDWQLKAIHDAYGALNVRYLDRPDVYVSCDLLIYYEEGDPRKSVVPDVFVVFGAAKRNRMIYKLWQEPKAPDFVLEVASKNTWREDLGRKRALYAQLGVREYWLFDPKEEYFDPELQGLGLRRARLSAAAGTRGEWRAGDSERSAWSRSARREPDAAFSRLRNGRAASQPCGGDDGCRERHDGPRGGEGRPPDCRGSNRRTGSAPARTVARGVTVTRSAYRSPISVSPGGTSARHASAQ